MNWINLLKLSRPRFWFYLLGPYLIGLVTSTSIYEASWLTLLWGIFFSLPANLFLYGINDIFDWETDRLNPKKSGYEILVQPQQRTALLVTIVGLLIPGIILSMYSTILVVIAFSLFMLLGFFYSAPPIRAKTKPFLDAFFNILYLMPALIGYFLIAGSKLNWYIIIAAGLWTMAMHAYSAIPDIKPDQEAKISTIATYLGKNRTLVFCTICYLASALLAGSQIGTIAYVLGLIYLVMMRISFQQKTSEDLFRIYKYFPLVNMISGFLLFLALLIARVG